MLSEMTDKKNTITKNNQRRRSLISMKFNELSIIVLVSCHFL